jgi:hypothetical protein
MIRKTVTVVLTLGAVGTGIACSVSLFSNWLLFSIGAVEVEIGSGALTLTSGAVFVQGVPWLWAYPRFYPLPGGDWILLVPFWIPFLLFATYPAIALIRGPLRRRRRRRRGLCVSCGYDLTGNVTGRCSECGSCM